MTSRTSEIHLPGSETVVDWFGRWPTFADAEILSLLLQRASDSRLEVLTWLTRSEVGRDGTFVREKHAIVVFLLTSITSLALTDFTSQNVIGGLTVEEHRENGKRLILDPCWGLNGYIEAAGIRVELVPLDRSSPLIR